MSDTLRSAASAGVGAFIAGSRVLAGLAGVSGVQPLSETITNVGVDVGVIGAAIALLRLEQRAGQKRLERISRGSRLAALRISGPQGIRPMKDSRWERRIVIVAGKAAKVVQAVNEAYELKEQFAEHSLQLVPVFPELDSIQEQRLQLAPEGDYRASVYDRNQWRKWLDVELDAARKALGEAVDDVYVIVVRMDGKVGARTAGPPNFEQLLENLRRLPKKDQYGKP